MNILDNIYGVLFKPNETFAFLTDKKFFSGATLIIVLMALLNALKNSVLLDISNSSTWLLFIINIISFIMIWIIYGAFLTFTADLFGGNGKISETMTGLAYSTLPLIFIPPIYILSLPLGGVGDNLYSITKIIIITWVLVLSVISIKHSHKFHTTQAVLSMVSLIFLVVLFMSGLGLISLLGVLFAANM